MCMLRNDDEDHKSHEATKLWMSLQRSTNTRHHNSITNIRMSHQSMSTNDPFEAPLVPTLLTDIGIELLVATKKGN